MPVSPATSASTTTPLSRFIAPRTVTPTSALTAASWENLDEGVSAASRKNRDYIIRRSSSFGASERSFTSNMTEEEEISLTLTPSRKNRDYVIRRSSSFGASERSFASYMTEEEEMPMDEIMTSGKTDSSTSASSLPPPEVRTTGGRRRASIGRSVRTVSSAEGLNAGFSKIISALEKKSALSSRPSNLSPQEHVLWGAIQDAALSEHKAKKKVIERQLACSYGIKEARYEKQISKLLAKLAERKDTSDVRDLPLSKDMSVQKLEEKLKETEALMKKNAAEHDSDIRAMQRVLADITTEREQETKELTEKVEALTTQLQGNSSSGVQVPTSNEADVDKTKANKEVEELKASLRQANADKDAAKLEADMNSKSLVGMEHDYKVVTEQLKKAQDEREILSREVEPLKQQIECLKSEIVALKQHKPDGATNSEVKQVRQGTESFPPSKESGNDNQLGSCAEVKILQQTLTEKAASLENAKMIIASLENANGALALDLRAKLKSKEEELRSVQNESAERKRRLDSFATELRDLQRKNRGVEKVEAQIRAQAMRLKALMARLKESVSDLQSASVVNEVATATGQPDSANIEQISEILCVTLAALRSTLETTECDDTSGSFPRVELPSEVGLHTESPIRKDREAAPKGLRRELDQKKTAVKRLEEALKKQNEELKKLRTELEGRNRGEDENAEILKAEVRRLREQCSTNLEVLAKKERELSVLRSSLQVDETDGGYISDDASDADEDETNAAIMHARMNGYGPAETEALATILANSGSGVEFSGRSREVEALRNELQQALSEKEKVAKDVMTERESLANAKMIISSLEKANKSMTEDLRSRLQDSNTAIASLLDKSMEHEKSANSLREEVDRLRKEKEEIQQKHQIDAKKWKDAKDRELNKLRKGSGQCKSSSEEKKEDLDESNGASTS